MSDIQTELNYRTLANVYSTSCTECDR